MSCRSSLSFTEPSCFRNGPTGRPPVHNPAAHLPVRRRRRKPVVSSVCSRSASRMSSRSTTPPCTPLPTRATLLAGLARGNQGGVDVDVHGVAQLQRAEECRVRLDAPLALYHPSRGSQTRPTRGVLDAAGHRDRVGDVTNRQVPI